MFFYRKKFLYFVLRKKDCVGRLHPSTPTFISQKKKIKEKKIQHQNKLKTTRLRFTLSRLNQFLFKPFKNYFCRKLSFECLHQTTQQRFIELRSIKVEVNNTHQKCEKMSDYQYILKIALYIVSVNKGLKVRYVY